MCKLSPRLCAFCLLACCFLCACTARDAVVGRSFPSDPSEVQRGMQLVKGLAACGFCHGESPRPDAILSGGGQWFDQYGAVYASNITPARTGIGDWSAEDIVQALRSSMRNDGEALSSGDVHSGFEWLTDRDALAIAAYLRSLPQVENRVRRREIGTIDRYTVGLFDTRAEIIGYVPHIPRRFQLELGKYLVDNVARCSACHNSPGSLWSSEEYLAGGREINRAGETKMAPDISASTGFGIGEWSEADIVSYLQTGATPQGREVDSRFCPVDFYRNADPNDLSLVAKYLKSTVP